MDILAWTLFGIINGLVLYSFENKKEKKHISPIGAILLSVFGALSGGTLAYLIFGNARLELSNTLLIAIVFEVALLYLLISGKSFKRI